MGGGPLLGGSAQVKTLVRLHLPHTPNHASAWHTLRVKRKSMVNIHRGGERPSAGHGRGAAVTARANRFIVET